MASSWRSNPSFIMISAQHHHLSSKPYKQYPKFESIIQGMELGGVVLVGARKRRGFEGDNYQDVRQVPCVFSLPVFSEFGCQSNYTCSHRKSFMRNSDYETSYRKSSLTDWGVKHVFFFNLDEKHCLIENHH